MGRREPKPTRRGKAIKRLREELGWSEESLGAANGVSKNVFNNLEKGRRKEPTREEAEKIITPLDLPPVALDMSDAFGRWVEAAAPPPGPVSPEEEDVRRCIVAAGLAGLHVARSLEPVLLRQVRDERIAQDRRQAAERCEHLRQLPTPAARRRRIESCEDYQTWSLVEALAHESAGAAAGTPAEAVDWARLALFTVPFVPGTDSRRHRLGGYATFFLGNAFQIANDLDAADLAVARAWEQWKAGAAEDILPLAEGTLLDLEASLRRAQGLFPESLDLHRRALDTCPEQAGRFLLNKASTLEQMGDVEGANEALRQARPHVESAGNPHDVHGLLASLAGNYLHLGQVSAAADLVPEVRAAAILLASEQALARSLWIEARTFAGLGRGTEAAAALAQVFEDLIGLELPHEAALAGMHLAMVHLEQGHSREVVPLARRLETVFGSLRIERPALATLLGFCEAARHEKATVELARQTAGILEKLRRRPSPPAPAGAPGRRGRGAGA